MIVRLTRGEYRQARSVAYELANFWYDKKKNQSLLAQAITGICGELAVIKCFNDTLGAEPRIKFNTDYQDGKDGGIDFNHAGMSWDSKVVTNGSEYVLKTKAQCVVGVARASHSRFYIMGFAPVSRLRAEQVSSWKWMPIQSVKSLFPQHFPHAPIPFGARKDQPTRVSDEIYGATLGPLIWKLQTGNWT